ncbi:MAG TPA: hypothetical protein VNF99_17520, partial [Stellaceae bacterium]|nr:hypothetical protein [Stellaceae bacterium]
IRAQLRDQFHGTTDPTTRTQVLRDALALAERRLTIVGRKLSQVQAVYHEEEERLTRIRGLLAEEESRARPPTRPT